MKNFWFIENVDLFEVLCPHAFGEYSKNHTFKSYGKNEFIYFEGDSSNTIYLIAEGKVKIGYNTEDGEEILKSVLRKGEIFGELALLGEDERSEFAQALEEPTVICPMSIEIFYQLMLQNRQLSLNIHKWIGLRIRKIERRLEMLVYKDVKTRFMEFLRELSIEYGTKRDSVTIIRHPFTQKDIGDLIGASRQTVNSLFNSLSQSGQITFRRKKIVLRGKLPLENPL